MDYFETRGYSASAIKAGAVSMLAMQDYFENGNETTAAMRKGTLRHTAILEPDKLDGLLICDRSKNTNLYKSLAELHGAENIITSKELKEANMARAQVMKHPEVLRLKLFTGGEVEKELYWQEDGIDCKCKIDYLQDDCFIEYKTCSDLRRFGNSAGQLNYHLQLGWYYRGCKRRCYIVAQESKSPYDVAVFDTSTLLLRAWSELAMRIVFQYESGDRSGAYPELLAFEMPAWCGDTSGGNTEIEF